MSGSTFPPKRPVNNLLSFFLLVYQPFNTGKLLVTRPASHRTRRDFRVTFGVSSLAVVVMFVLHCIKSEVWLGGRGPLISSRVYCQLRFK